MKLYIISDVSRETMPRMYTNNGLHSEQLFKFDLTGIIYKHDNKPFWEGGDFEDIQIKSSRATVSHGADMRAHIKRDAAKRYAYVCADLKKVYIMTPEEWYEFTMKFSTITTDSEKNGGGEKRKLKRETDEMREWLAGRL